LWWSILFDRVCLGGHRPRFDRSSRSLDQFKPLVGSGGDNVLGVVRAMYRFQYSWAMSSGSAGGKRAK
jgi:hypothetical protein